jgi:hypothetical protein
MSTLIVSEELKAELANAIRAYGSVLYAASLGIAPKEFDWLNDYSNEELKYKIQILKDFYSQL